MSWTDFTTADDAIESIAAVGEMAVRGAIALGESQFNGLVTNDATLGQSQYDFRYRTFPEDLTNDYVGHYMVININVPVFATNQNAQRTSYTGSQTLLSNELSKVDALRFGGAVSIPGSNPIFGGVS